MLYWKISRQEKRKCPRYFKHREFDVRNWFYVWWMLKNQGNNLKNNEWTEPNAIPMAEGKRVEIMYLESGMQGHSMGSTTMVRTARWAPLIWIEKLYGRSWSYWGGPDTCDNISYRARKWCILISLLLPVYLCLSLAKPNSKSAVKRVCMNVVPWDTERSK